MLELRVRKRVGGFALEADLAIPARTALVVVGESGSGKTTLLRLIAGLLDPDQGRIACEGRTLVDREAGVLVPPSERRVGYVPQDYGLFPHLTARDNVAFGLHARGLAGEIARSRADRALARMGVAALAVRRPHQLSGGQQQRVALARALAIEPEILLLDEPLAALDLASRRAVRGELRQLLGELSCVTVLVTHSPQEALAFGERIAVLESGRVSQHGTREELLHRPRSRYVADFLGTNMFVAKVGHREPSGLTRLVVEGGEIVAAEAELEGEVFAVVDPREIGIYLAPPGGSAQNVLRGRVDDLQPEPPSGDRVRVSVATRPPLVAELTRAAAETLGLAIGLEVTVTFKATGVKVFR